MRDPERLLSASSDADAFERELLASLRGEAAPPHAKRALWQGIAMGLAAAAPASTAAASTAAGSGAVASSFGSKGGSLLLAKWALVGALGAGAASGAYWVSQRAPAALVVQPSKVVRPSKVVQPKAAPSPALVEHTVVPEPVPEVAPTPQPLPIKRDTSSSLAAESELLRVARAHLRAGDLAAAERSLQLQRKRYPRGVLGQERDVLRIELLRARGDDAAARTLAKQFLRAHPESPHAARLRPLVAAP